MGLEPQEPPTLIGVYNFNLSLPLTNTMPDVDLWSMYKGVRKVLSPRYAIHYSNSSHEKSKNGVLQVKVP